METLQLRERRTFRYVGTHKHLDAWRDLGVSARLTPERLVREPMNYDDGGTYHRWATIPARADRDAAARALEDVLTSHGCAHEWDCCGCASWRTSVVLRKGRRLLLRTTVSYNY